jgi:hypothetical protein
VYCRQSCRQRDYEARLRSAEVGLGEDELIITRTELELIKDRLYMLACTVEDAERDLNTPEATKARELRRVLNYVMAAANECVRSDAVA